MEVDGEGRPEIDHSLREATVNDCTDDVSFVVRIVAADSTNLNDVTRVLAILHIGSTKAKEERLLSRAAFVKLTESTKAWRVFTGKDSRKDSPAVGTMLVPSSEPPDMTVEAPRRLRRAEHVLEHRTGRILLVLERCIDNLNQQAILRTAECLGIQNVWLVNDPNQRKKNESLNRNVTMKADDWLSIRTFTTTKACITALHEDGREIWATDLSTGATCLDTATDIPVPPRLAIVAGREGDGVSQEMLQAATRRIYLPMYGFTDSFNLSVAMALLIQRLFFMCPTARGDLTAEEKHQLRIEWYTKLAKGVEKNRLTYARYINHPPPPLDDLRDPTKQPGMNKGIMKSRKRINQRLQEAKSIGDQQTT